MATYEEPFIDWERYAKWGLIASIVFGIIAFSSVWAVAIYEKNILIVFAGIIWLIYFFVVIAMNFPQKLSNAICEVPSWIPEEFGNLYILWVIFLPALALMALSLFVVGPVKTSNYDYLLVDKQGTVQVFQVNNANPVVFHIPLVDKVTWWHVNYNITVAPTAITADGKKIVAEMDIQLATPNYKSMVEILYRQFGSEDAYRKELEREVAEEFVEVIAQYNLADLSNTLLMEDHVSTNLGLEDAAAFWSGPVVITEIHRTAN